MPLKHRIICVISSRSFGFFLHMSDRVAQAHKKVKIDFRNKFQHFRPLVSNSISSPLVKKMWLLIVNAHVLFLVDLFGEDGDKKRKTTFSQKVLYPGLGLTVKGACDVRKGRRLDFRFFKTGNKVLGSGRAGLEACAILTN